MKTYSELIKLPTFQMRKEYLMLASSVGEFTFNGHRYLNQQLYTSDEWLSFRDEIILRDGGCDLGVSGYDIFKYATVHHIDPITQDDIRNRHPKIFDPENVILCSSATHREIHYGVKDSQVPMFIERRPNDTTPWKV